MSELSRIPNSKNCRLVKIGLAKVLFSTMFNDELHLGFLDTDTGITSDLIRTDIVSARGDGGVYLIGPDASFIISSGSNNQTQNAQVINTTKKYPVLASTPLVYRKGSNVQLPAACGANNMIFATCAQGPNLFYDILRWTGSELVVDAAGTFKNDPMCESNSQITTVSTTVSNPPSALISWSTLAANERCQLTSVRFDRTLKDRNDAQFSDSLPLGENTNHQHIIVFSDMTAIIAFRVGDRSTAELARIRDVRQGLIVDPIITFNYSIKWMDFVLLDNTRALMFYQIQGTSDLKYRIVTNGENVGVSQEISYRDNCKLWQGVNISPGTVVLALKDDDSEDLIFETLTV